MTFRRTNKRNIFVPTSKEKNVEEIFFEIVKTSLFVPDVQYNAVPMPHHLTYSTIYIHAASPGIPQAMFNNCPAAASVN